MLSVTFVGVGLRIGRLIYNHLVSRVLVLHVALLDEPVKCGSNSELGVLPVEPSRKAGLEELLDTVRPSLLVISVDSESEAACTSSCGP